ncbi:MAG: hypothetical protein ACRDH6_03215 [Actinomycetota bacterium]
MTLAAGAHGVIVIHGIGEGQRRGDLLARVTNGIADSLLESLPAGEAGPLGDPVIRDMDAFANPPSASLRIPTTGGAETTWIFKEAFWADSFPAPPPETVFRWLLRHNAGAHLQAVWHGLSRDPTNDQDFNPEEPEPPEWSSGGWTKTIYRAGLLLGGVLLLVLAVLAPVLRFVLGPLYWVSQVGPARRFLGFLHRIDPLLSRSVGDAQRYLEHGMWSANVRGVLEEVLSDMLHDRYGPVSDVTIVAHSMGAVVAYDALAAGGRIAAEIALLPKARRKKITLFTVGAGINQTFRLAKTSNTYARRRFARPLAPEVTGLDSFGLDEVEELRSRFYWVDVHARFDPVPAGPLADELQDQARLAPEQVKKRRVINLDSPVRDHSIYWENKDLFVPRLLRAINSGEYPWEEAGITPAKVARHTKRVGRLWLARLAVVAAVVGASVAAAFLTPVSWVLISAIALTGVGIYRWLSSDIAGDLA